MSKNDLKRTTKDNFIEKSVIPHRKRQILSVILSLILIFATAFAYAEDTQGAANKEGSGSEPKYSALLIPSVNSNLGDYPSYDSTHFETALRQSSNDFRKITTYGADFYGGSTTYNNVLDKFYETFKDSQDGDINIVYYSGHGASSSSSSVVQSYICITDQSNYFLSAQAIRNYVNQNNIKGTFIFVIDACHSGGLIEKGEEILEEEGDNPTEGEDILSNDKDTLTEGKDASTKTKGEDTPKKGEYTLLENASTEEINDFARNFAIALNTPSENEPVSKDTAFMGTARYKVLAAAMYQQYSWQRSLEEISGFFTTVLVNGIGYSPANGTSNYPNASDTYTTVNHHAYAADTNNDGYVTVSEIYKWTLANNTICVPRCYPENDNTPLVKYNRSNYSGAKLISAKISNPVVTKGSNAVLTVNYETETSCQVLCQAPVFEGNSYYSIRKPDDTLTFDSYLDTSYLFGLLGKISYKCYMGNSGVLQTFTAGRYDSATHTYKGSATVTIDTSNLSDGKYFLRLLPSCSGGTAWLVPFNVISGNAYASDSTYFDVTAPQTYTVSDSNCNEMTIEIAYDGCSDGHVKYFSNSTDYPGPTGVTIDCVVKDEEGEVVKTLAQNELLSYFTNVFLDAPYKKNAFDTTVKLYWDGKDDSGEYVVCGNYTLEVSGHYYGCDANNRLISKSVSETIAFEISTPKLPPSVVTFVSDGVTVATEVVENGALATGNDIPSLSKDGYVLAGWYTRDGETEDTENGGILGNWGEKWDLANDTISEELTLYARWSNEYENDGIRAIDFSEDGVSIEIGCEKSFYVFLSEYTQNGKNTEIYMSKLINGDEDYTNTFTFADDAEYQSGKQYKLFIVDSELRFVKEYAANPLNNVIS